MKLRSLFSAAIIAAMIMTFFGTEFTYAAALKKPAQVKGVSATAESGTKITVKWNKVSKNVKGYTVYRNGKTVARVGKSQTSYTDAGLTPNTSYSYTVKAYNTQTKYYNSKTKKWVTKKPKKSQWKGKKSKKSYKYSKASAAVAMKTKKVSSGGSDKPQSQRTRITGCVNYLNKPTPDMWLDAEGKYWSAQTGGFLITQPYLRDKRMNAKWDDGRQENGVTVFASRTPEGKVYCAVYNGDVSRAKLRVQEPTQKYYTKAGDDYLNSTYVLAGSDRLTRYSEWINQEEAKEELIMGFNLSYAYGHDGFGEGSVHIDAWYDFNEDGLHADDELLNTIVIDVKPSLAAQQGYELAKKAVEYYGTSNYDDDMKAIAAYMYKNYNYFAVENDTKPYSCIGGGNALRSWSIKKYGVYGAVQEVRDGHEAFYPSYPNAHTNGSFFEANGYGAHGDTPGTALYDTNLRILESGLK